MLKVFLVIAAALVGLTPAAGQTYPNKPVRVIVPYPPGGGTDVLGRVIAKALSAELGQQFYIDNRPGADATIGATAAAKSAPDGYTLLVVSGVPFVINQSVFSKLPYHTVKDFAAVSLFAQWPLVLLVNPQVPANTMKDFVAYLKTAPAKLNYAGSDQMTFMAMEMIKTGTGTDMQHIPYKGVGPALVDVMGGHVSAMLSSAGPALPQIKDGKVKVLAQTTKTRSRLLPDIPTIAETAIPGYEVLAWYGIFAPTGTPPEIVNLLNRAIAKVSNTAEVQEQFTLLGAESVDMSAADFGKFVAQDVEKWAKEVKASGIPIQ